MTNTPQAVPARLSQAQRQAIAARIRWLTNHGRHLEASALYRSTLAKSAR